MEYVYKVLERIRMDLVGAKPLRVRSTSKLSGGQGYEIVHFSNIFSFVMLCGIRRSFVTFSLHN